MCDVSKIQRRADVASIWPFPCFFCYGSKTSTSFDDVLNHDRCQEKNRSFFVVKNAIKDKTISVLVSCKLSSTPRQNRSTPRVRM